jgi:hypothetical protein
MTIKVKIGEAYDPRKTPKMDKDSERVQRALLPPPPYTAPPGFTLDGLILAVCAVGVVVIFHGMITGWL